MYIYFFFFFSSRRRHTRSLCDWSSDVCSSDLDRRERRHRKRLLGRQVGDAPQLREDEMEPIGAVGQSACFNPDLPGKTDLLGDRKNGHVLWHGWIEFGIRPTPTPDGHLGLSFVTLVQRASR